MAKTRDSSNRTEEDVQALHAACTGGQSLQPQPLQLPQCMPGDGMPGRTKGHSNMQIKVRSSQTLRP